VVAKLQKVAYARDQLQAAMAAGPRDKAVLLAALDAARPLRSLIPPQLLADAEAAVNAAEQSRWDGLFSQLRSFPGDGSGGAGNDTVAGQSGGFLSGGSNGVAAQQSNSLFPGNAKGAAAQQQNGSFHSGGSNGTAIHQSNSLFSGGGNGAAAQQSGSLRFGGSNGAAAHQSGSLFFGGGGDGVAAHQSSSFFSGGDLGGSGGGVPATPPPQQRQQQQRQQQPHPLREYQPFPTAYSGSGSADFGRRSPIERPAPNGYVPFQPPPPLLAPLASQHNMWSAQTLVPTPVPQQTPQQLPLQHHAPRQQHALPQQYAPPQQMARQPSSREDERDLECVVCWAAEKQAVVVPCGHACLCRTCAAKLAASALPSCPICRGKIRQILNIADS